MKMIQACWFMGLLLVLGLLGYATGVSAGEYLPGDKVEAILGAEGESGVAVVKAGTSVVLKGRIKKAQTKYLIWRLQQKFGNIIDVTSMEPEAAKKLIEAEQGFSKELALSFDAQAQESLSQNLQFRVVEGRLVISGSINNPEDIERITKIAKLYDKDPVINVEVRRDMIEIDAVFCRINRAAGKHIGTTGLQSATITIPNYNLTYNGVTGKFGEAAGMTDGSFTNNGWSAGISSGVNNQLSSYFQVSAADVKLLVRPHLSTLNGKEAIFHSGGQQPFTIATDTVQSIQWKDYGTKLTVLPMLTTDNKIDVNVTLEFLLPNNDSLNRFTKFSHSGRAILEHNQALVLSGLVQQMFQMDVTRTPGLSNMPILGFFFGDKNRDHEQSEMVVVVMPQLTRPLTGQGMNKVFRSSVDAAGLVRNVESGMGEIPDLEENSRPKDSPKAASGLSCGDAAVQQQTVIVDSPTEVIVQPAQTVVHEVARAPETKTTTERK